MDIPVPALRAATEVVRWAPAPLAHGVGRVAAVPVSRFSADERRIVARNLRRVTGSTPSRLDAELHIQRVYASYARYWVDALRLPNLSRSTIQRGFSHDGMHHIDEAMAKGTAPILALPHLGGWEWAARWLVLDRGHEVAAVVEELDPPELYDWFLEFRESLGMQVIPLGPSALGEVAAAISAGKIMCLLADRDISGAGIEVEFFGERTTLPGGPALMALRTGAPLIPVAVYFRGRRCHAVVEPPLHTHRRGRLRDDVTRITQDLAEVLERQIRRAPEQWHLLQPNWPSDYVALGRPLPGPGRGQSPAGGSATADR